MQKKLEQKVKRIDKELKCGDSIDFIYDGEVINECRYKFFERSIDSKTPLQWLRSCILAEISFKKGRDISKVTLKHNKVTEHQIGNCRIRVI